MAYLQLRGIEKFFGEHRAIKGIDLSIQKGEFIVFVGPRAAASPRCCG